MKIRPLGKKVLVKLVEKEQARETAGGIIIPDIVKDDRLEGIVVGLGPEATKEIKVGDRVTFLKYSGDPVEVNGEKHKLLDDILLIGAIEE